MSDPSEANRQRAGYLYGLVAYTCWGLVPLYFSVLKEYGVGAGEILAHRIGWCLPIMLALTAAARGWPALRAVLRSRRLLLTMLLSAVLLALNWLLYIYATVTGRVAEAGLGYFLMPLVNVFLGTVFLGERLRPAHYPALGLVAVGLMMPFAAGTFSWLAVALPVTFGVYGLVRKKAPVDGLTGLTAETLLLLAPSLAFLAWQGAAGGGHFGPDGRLNALLAFSGVVTVVPLLTFTLSLRRLPLVAVSFIQFLSPTVQTLVAVYVLGERPAWYIWAASGCVWAAVVIFVADAVTQARNRQKAHRPPPVGLNGKPQLAVTR